VDFVNGAKLLVRPGMRGATGNVYLGLQEFEEMAFVMHLLRPGDLFVDVGANVGSYTVLAAAGVGADCISFEPDPEAFEWLRRNLDLNAIGARVQARQEALGGKVDQIAFSLGRDTVNHVVPGDSSEERTQLVSMVTLDDALGQRNPVMIKVDVEGFETEVVSGAGRALAHPDLCCVLMELAGMGQRYGFDEAHVRKLMERQGFGEYSYAPFERSLTAVNSDTNNSLFVRNLPYVRKRLAEAPPIAVMGMKF
jgi:FkbM family methyltransferase